MTILAHTTQFGLFEIGWIPLPADTGWSYNGSRVVSEI
jgi:hypothetical protein